MRYNEREDVMECLQPIINQINDFDKTKLLELLNEEISDINTSLPHLMLSALELGYS